MRPICGTFSVPPQNPESPARHLDASQGKNRLPTVSRQFLTRNHPHPNCLLKCLPNCLSPAREGFFSSFKVAPPGEGNCAAIKRQKLSCGNFCLAASRCLSRQSGNWFATMADLRPRKPLGVIRVITTYQRADPKQRLVRAVQRTSLLAA